MISLQDAQSQFNDTGAQNAVNADVASLGQYTTTLASAPTAPHQTISNVSGAQPSNISKFAHFLGGLASQSGSIALGAGKWLVTNTVNMVEAPGKLGAGLGNSILDKMSINQLDAQTKQASAQQATLSAQFKAGKITAKQYQLGMKSLVQTFNDLEKQQLGINAKVGFDKQNTTKALIDTAGALTTVLTVGFGKATTTIIDLGDNGLALTPIQAKTAGEWLTSKVAEPMLTPAIKAINRVASDSEVWAKLDSVTQAAFQRASAEVVSTAAENMTSAEIAKATAVNFALKYPLIFNYTSTTAQDVYKELDDKKYGDAVRTMAFNAALLLSGGPITHAFKYGGDAIKGITARTFGQTSFWDVLSTYYGDQTAAGFSSAITKIAQSIENPIERGQFIKNLAAVEATNLKAVGGDVAAAAERLAKGMQGTYSFDLTQVSHEDAVNDMVKWAKNYRLAQEAASESGLGQIAVGRLDARDKQSIMAAITGAGDTAGRLKAWEQWKVDNPNAAAAYNDNFDRQIKQLIESEGKDLLAGNSSEMLGNKIMKIEAQITVDGFPKDVAEKMAKDGYIPIRPKNIETPFHEGGDRLVTKYAEGQDFFTKAVQPLPVLDVVGQLLTSVGLSPYAASERTYQMFNENLTKNLNESGVIKKILGETPEETTDSLIKQISNYAKGLKMPAQDMRMLTVKHISKATGMSMEESRLIQKAISKSYMEVPLFVRGMGDRLVDFAYGKGVGVATRRYLRIQGAARFGWNPFFQYLRLIPKTEILSESQGGGFFYSLFAGRLGEISAIRKGLRDGGILNEVGSIGSMTGEATEIAGAMSRNLSKKLLPAQEVSIAGLIDAQAQRVGMTWKDFIRNYPQETKDTIQRIVEYDRNSQFLNSPLARTLNIAFFPFRFDTKVAILLGEGLSKTSLITQVAVINSLLKAHDWLNTDEGKAWYAKHSTAIGLFNYITPLASLSEAMQSLLPGQDHSLGNFGELGGLPFGWITQMLDAEGLTHFNQAGVDAATGQAFPKYIPATEKGAAAIAIQDLIGSLFSYPGAQIGLPSKTGITRNISLGILGANKNKDLQLEQPKLNKEQQEYSDIIQSMQPGYRPELAPEQAPSVNTIPLLGQTTAAPKYKNGKPSARAKKKSEYTPALLPGQTTLGQIP